MAQIIQTVEVTSAGGTTSIDLSLPTSPDIVFIYAKTSVTLINDFEIIFPNAPEYKSFEIIFSALDTINQNGNNFIVNGQYYTPEMLNVNYFKLSCVFINSIIGASYIYQPTMDESDPFIGGSQILDNTLNVSKLLDIPSGNIIVGNASNKPSVTTVSGDVTLSSTGVVSVVNGAVTDAKIASNISRTKLQLGSSNHVLINDVGGVISSETALNPIRGGTGQNFSSATGFQKWNGGVASVSEFIDTKTIEVSFETGLVGDFKIKMPFAGTFTDVYGFLITTIGAVDANVTIKNNSGTNMTGTPITFIASSPKGTAASNTITGNNTFIAGDIITISTSGGATTGKCLVSLTYTRLS